VFAKIGVERVPSNLATAVRTAIVLTFAWAIVIARGGSWRSAPLCWWLVRC
jgi:transporter family protein